MGDFRLTDGMASELAGQVEASTSGTTVTTSGSANTKGAWSQLIAATARDATGINVFLASQYGTSLDVMCDIGIGAGGSEQVICPNLILYSAADMATYFFPISIPAGTRIAARAQGSGLSWTPNVYCLLVEEGLAAPCAAGRVTDYGTSTATSDGTTVVTSVSANTKGSWTQLTASTANQMSAAVVSLSCLGNPAYPLMVDLAVGAGGSEQIIAGDLPLIDASTSGTTACLSLPLTIPAGTRIAARAQTSYAFGTQTCYVAVYGIE